MIENKNSLTLRAVRPAERSDVASLVGMIKAPSGEVPRRLEDFDPAAELNVDRRWAKRARALALSPAVELPT